MKFDNAFAWAEMLIRPRGRPQNSPSGGSRCGGEDRTGERDMMNRQHKEAAPTEGREWRRGCIVTFGRYPQNADGKDKTPIEWIVLSTDGETATLISRYALDRQFYNTTWEDVTWEDCTLRKWLNGVFLEAAFGRDEQERLLTVEVTADRNPRYITDPGRATRDRVYLLSTNEAERYFSSDSERICKPTPYAEAQWAVTDDMGACWWWFRSPGGREHCAACVNFWGAIPPSGDSVCGGDIAVRPVIVIGLSK